MEREVKLSPRRAELLALAALGLHLLFFILLLVIGGRAASLAGKIEGWHFLGGVLIWLVLVLQFRQRRLAEEERLDGEQIARLRREGRETSVFEGALVEAELQVAGRRLRWLEKWLLPIVGLLTAAYLLATGWVLLRQVRGAGPGGLAGHTVILESAAYLAGIALVSFLFSRYAVGLSQQAEWRPLRAGGSYLLGNALACFALAAVLLVAERYSVRVERVLAYALGGVMAALGAEIVLNLLLDAFRPRVAGQYHRAAFESRLLGLFSEPGGILRTAAHALDYQFGFKVSETWFFKLLARAVVPLAVAWGLTLYLLSCLAVVPAGSVGVLERWGRPVNVAGPYGSGLHVKWPWPVERIRSFPVEQVQTIDVGFERRPSTWDAQGREVVDLAPVLWTKEHWKKEYPFLLPVAKGSLGGVGKGGAEAGEAQGKAGGAGVGAAGGGGGAREPRRTGLVFDQLVVATTVQYRIRDVGQYGYGRGTSYQDPRALLESLCHRALLHYASTHDLATLLGPGRDVTAQRLREAIQGAVNAHELGVEIVFVGLVSVHPPIEVAGEFEKVVSALQVKQAEILKARGEASRILAEAAGASRVARAEAEGYQAQRRAVAGAEAERFGQQVEAYRRGGQAYLEREYLAVLEELLPKLRKYVLASGRVDSRVYEFDLKEKLEPDFFRELGTGRQAQETGK